MLLSSSLPSYFWIEVANYFILETTYGMDDDSEDEDHEFYFSLENCNLLDLAAVNENQLKGRRTHHGCVLDFENKIII